MFWGITSAESCCEGVAQEPSQVLRKKSFFRYRDSALFFFSYNQTPNSTVINSNLRPAHTLFARHSFVRRLLSDKVVYRAGEVGVSVLCTEDVLQPRPTSGLVPHGPVVVDANVRGCIALQKNCAGFIGCVPGGIVSQGGLFSNGL